MEGDTGSETEWVRISVKAMHDATGGDLLIAEDGT